jgi:hypothetical protein
MIVLPAKETNEGAEVRLLLAECRGPSYPGFELGSATVCMQLMDLVLWNRVKSPAQFLAKSATLLAVIKARGQFQGFENYPNYNPGIKNNIQQMINIANNTKDRRSAEFAGYIRMAIQVAIAETILDPSRGTLVAWQTSGFPKPGPNFILYKTVLGNDFYFIA